MSTAPHWRRVIAALADAERRLAYARILVADAEGSPLPAPVSANQRKRIATLLGAGLVTEREGLLRAADPYTALLADDPARVPDGPERFLPGGRLLGLPRRGSDRAAVFALIAARVLTPDELLDERQVTERLAAITDDPVALRRYLVDAGVLARDPDGTGYRRPPACWNRSTTDTRP